MCEIVPGVVRSTERVEISSMLTVSKDEPFCIGPLDDPGASKYLVLECRHDGGEWETHPLLSAGQVLSCPAGSEVRLIGKSKRKARKWDRLKAHG